MDVGVICNSGIDMSNSVVGKQSFAVPINSVVSTADNCKVVELVDGSTVDSNSIGNITSFVDKVDTAGFMCICIGDGPNTSGSGREVFKLGATLVLVVQSGGTGELSNVEGLAIRFQKYDYLYICNNIVLLLKELLHLLLTAVEACLHLLFFPSHDDSAKDNTAHLFSANCYTCLYYSVFVRTFAAASQICFSNVIVRLHIIGSAPP